MSEYGTIVKSAIDEGTRTTLMDAFSLCLTLHRDRVAAEEEIADLERESARLREDVEHRERRLTETQLANAGQFAELRQARSDLAAFETVKADREKSMRACALWQQRVTVLHAHLINVERRYVPEALWTDPHPERDHPRFMPGDDDLARSMQAVLRDFDQATG